MQRKFSQPTQAVHGHSWQVCFHLVNMTWHLVFFSETIAKSSPREKLHSNHLLSAESKNVGKCPEIFSPFRYSGLWTAFQNGSLLKWGKMSIGSCPCWWCPSCCCCCGCCGSWCWRTCRCCCCCWCCCWWPGPGCDAISRRKFQSLFGLEQIYYINLDNR